MRVIVKRVSQAAVSTGATCRFGADMQARLVNDGPVTLAIDTRNSE